MKEDLNKNMLAPNHTKFNRSGIYLIRHIPSKRVYVGQAASISGRWTNHLFWLRKGNHHSSYLQRVWSKYGEEQFEFRVAQFCSIDKLDELETKWYNKFKGYVLNIRPPGKQARGFILPLSARKKISAAHKIISADPEERKRRSERCAAQHKEGRIGKREKIIKFRICCTCKNKFQVPRVPNGGFSGSRFCPNCPSDQHGGYYKTAGKPVGPSSRICKKCKTSYMPHRLETGQLSQSYYCPDCRPDKHNGGCYKHVKKV